MQKTSISQMLVTAASFGVFVYFAYHLVHGDHGYFALKGLQQKIAAAETVHAAKLAERTVLENRVKLLRPDSLDLDMLDERARIVLGFLKQEDRVLIRHN